VFVQPELTQNFALQGQTSAGNGRFLGENTVAVNICLLFISHTFISCQHDVVIQLLSSLFSHFPLQSKECGFLSNTIEFSEWKHMLIFLFQNC